MKRGKIKKEISYSVTRRRDNKLVYKDDKHVGFKTRKGAEERTKELVDQTRIEEVSSTGIDNWDSQNRK